MGGRSDMILGDEKGREEPSEQRGSDDESCAEEQEPGTYGIEGLRSVRRCRRNKRQLEFLVKWEGYSERESTWEPESEMLRAAPLLVRRLAQRAQGPDSDCDGPTKAVLASRGWAYLGGPGEQDEQQQQQQQQEEEQEEDPPQKRVEQWTAQADRRPACRRAMPKAQVYLASSNARDEQEVPHPRKVAAPTQNVVATQQQEEEEEEEQEQEEQEQEQGEEGLVARSRLQAVYCRREERVLPLSQELSSQNELMRRWRKVMGESCRAQAPRLPEEEEKQRQRQRQHQTSSVHAPSITASRTPDSAVAAIDPILGQGAATTACGAARAAAGPHPPPSTVSHNG
jgi:hypothetical protein